jgi:MoxR-like ATPase
MSETNLYRRTPRQVRTDVIDCLYAGLVPFVQSSPGMGKSSIMRSIANELGLHLIDHRLSTSSPEDLSGLPRFDEKGRAHFSPFADLFPLQDSEPPAGKDGWMLFLDEANSATKNVQAASYKLVLDRMTGQEKLHERCAITMAGNLSTDRAIVNPLSTAMQSRVVHIEMELNFEEWLYDVALKENYDERIIAFLNYDNSKLMDFRPDHQEKTFCCPRTWEFMNRLVSGKEITDDKTALYSGTITSGVAVEFVQFTQVYKKMVTVDEILRDPVKAPVPNDNSTRWAVISHMMSKVTEKIFADLCTYANRFDMTFRILFFRSVMVRQPQLRAHPAFASAMSELSRYLNG